MLKPVDGLVSFLAKIYLLPVDDKENIDRLNLLLKIDEKDNSDYYRELYNVDKIKITKHKVKNKYLLLKATIVDGPDNFENNNFKYPINLHSIDFLSPSFISNDLGFIPDDEDIIPNALETVRDITQDTIIVNKYSLLYEVYKNNKLIKSGKTKIERMKDSSEDF